MMKFFLCFLFTLLSLLCVNSQTRSLGFDANGKFKIVQFTDIHYIPDNDASRVATDLMAEVLDAVKPDLVVFTGDIIWQKPVYKGLDDVFDLVAKRKIAWAYILGNHDDEFGVSRKQLIEYAMTKPYCLAQVGDENLKGAGNYILEIKDRSMQTTKAVLYFMDSGAYSPIEGLGTYDWFGFEQIGWYRKQSGAYTLANGGIPYPALAFFHIPLVEYSLMKADPRSTIVGHRDETECNGFLNTGMFAAMRESGDVMGTFVGHDHNNDYIGSFMDIALAYGRYSGGKTVYNDLGLNGCRVIELTEGKREFETYIRLLGGDKIFPVIYPDSILPREVRK